MASRPHWTIDCFTASPAYLLYHATHNLASTMPSPYRRLLPRRPRALVGPRHPQHRFTRGHSPYSAPRKEDEE
ncbi:hypothetical protein GUJ93_ZPchr0007g4340 [Zizania palustris]|uniref:Uncharacterized protein n=1 Tax=Zizania palustris TaxID=103762 RepID=A0A8J5T605_ZIZPA|nr:hypothetical protein GUJ93_ZPchr0007g4340 [Zizania palustris]